MADELSFSEKVQRFGANEGKVDTFVNGNDSESFTTSGGVEIPTISNLVKVIKSVARGTVRPSDSPWFADPTGTSPAGALINQCIQWAIENNFAVDLYNGVWGVVPTAPINLNGLNEGLANTQWASVVEFKGNGRGFGQCVINCLPGTKVSDTDLYGWGANKDKPAIIGRNMAGRVIQGFTVRTNDLTNSPVYFPWIGGSQGNANLAPAGNNILRDVMVDGGGLNLDQMHDSSIESVWSRGTPPGKVALSLKGGGGQLLLDKVFLSSGLLQVECQNAGFTNSGFFGGILISGTSSNTVSLFSCHVYSDSTTGKTIDSTSTGTATRLFSAIGCYFNPTDSATGIVKTVVSGNYRVGGTFIGGLAHGYDSFFGNIVPVGGAGQVPVFSFKGFTFNGPIPQSVAGQYSVDIENCIDQSGNIINNRLPDLTTSVLSSGVKKDVKLAYDISMVDGTWYPILQSVSYARGVGKLLAYCWNNDQPILNASFGRVNTNPATDQFSIHNGPTTGVRFELKWDGGNQPPMIRLVGLTAPVTISAEYII